MDYIISSTTLGILKECPRCFWFHIVKNIRRPETPFPSLPSGMDKILKEHFDRFIEKNLLPPELKNLKALEGCSLFNDKEKLDTWRNYRKGLRYRDKESGITLMGAIDNLLVRNNKLIILDYKTRGYPCKEDTHEHYTDQMDIYAFLLEKLGNDIEKNAYLLFYYPNKVNETGEIIFDTKLVEMPLKTENAEKILKKAIKILSMKEAPAQGLDCNFCNWKSKFSQEK